MMSKHVKAVKPNVEELINHTLQDNTSGLITPRALREVLHNMAVVMQNDHASLRNGGFVGSDGLITHYTTGATTPFLDGYVDPQAGVFGVTADYPVISVDASLYFEVTGAETFKVCCAVNGVVDEDFYATLSAGNNSIQFRKVLHDVKANQEVTLYIKPSKPTTPYSSLSLIKIDMDIYPVRIGINT